MASFIHQPNLTEGLSLIGWRLKRDAEIEARKNEANFECEVEPSSISYAAFEQMSATDDNYDPYASQNLELCLEVDAMNLNNISSEQTNDDYDPHEVYMRIHSRRTNTSRLPLALLPSQSTLANNHRHYNFADDDTPIKYPLAIGVADRRTKQTQNTIPRPNNKRVTFRQTVDEDPPLRRFHTNNDLDADIAPTVTEMDMLDDEQDNEPITKSLYKNLSYQSTTKRSNTLQDDQQDQQRKRYRLNDDDRIPARRGHSPSQEDPSRKHPRIISQFEEQHGLKLGDICVYAPKLRLRISSVNVNWINLPSIPNFPNKVHPS